MDILTTMDGTERPKHSTKVTISAMKTVSFPAVSAGIHLKKNQDVHLEQLPADRIRISNDK